MELLYIIGGIWLVTYILDKLASSSRRTYIQSQDFSAKKPSSPKMINVKQDDIEDIELSEEQTNVFNLIEITNNLFYITGKAGTGKSVLLRYFVAKTRKRVVVVAPTGVAALNVGGQTIHSDHCRF